jgi:hypothetical protein
MKICRGIEPLHLFAVCFANAANENLRSAEHLHLFAVRFANAANENPWSAEPFRILPFAPQAH